MEKVVIDRRQTSANLTLSLLLYEHEQRELGPRQVFDLLSRTNYKATAFLFAYPSLTGPETLCVALHFMRC